MTKSIVCTEEMLKAFKKVFYSEQNDSETLRDLTMNAIEAAIEAHTGVLPTNGTTLVGRFIEPGPNFKGAERVPSIRTYEEYSETGVKESLGYWIEGEKVYTLK